MPSALHHQLRMLFGVHAFATAPRSTLASSSSCAAASLAISDGWPHSNAFRLAVVSPVRGYS